MSLSSLTAAIEPLNLRSCLILKENRLIAEYYRTPRIADEPAKINSCTKSVLSALVCIAFDRGILPSPATMAAEFFPQLAVDADSRKREITLEQLLTMSAGFDWTEFGGQNSFPAMTRSPHWVNFVLDLPLADPPGTRMEYNSGISQMLSAILMQASGTTTARFAETYLFEPLGIEAYKWESDPQGVHTGGFGLWLRPADMLKFGQLYLQEGKFEGKQLISQELVTRSLQPMFDAGAPRSGCYGWHWWADTYQPPEQATRLAQGFDYYFARGFGGQFIYIVPSHKSVVVITQDSRKKNQQRNVFTEIIAPLLIQQP